MAKTPGFKHRDGRALDLVLYGRDSCPFCVRVAQTAEKLGLHLPTRNPETDDDARKTLEEVGGKTQVPCLFIDGKALYESMDIITFLENEVAHA